MIIDNKEYAFVTEINNIKLYRSVDNPKDEIAVDGDKWEKVKIKEVINGN